MAAARTVKALDELGLVDASHKTDVVTKVSEVRQVVVAAGRIHLHRCAHHRHQLQVSVLAAQATGERHGSALHMYRTYTCLQDWVYQQRCLISAAPSKTTVHSSGQGQCTAT